MGPVTSAARMTAWRSRGHDVSLTSAVAQLPSAFVHTSTARTHHRAIERWCVPQWTV